MDLGVIYKATCLITGKSYIGQTKHFEIRKKQHLQAKDNYIFHKALRKYGQENFKWEILEECSYDLLNEKETYWIKFYNSYSNGYNSTLGGDDSSALEKWRKNNPEKVKANALNGIKYANKYHESHQEKHTKQILEAQKLGANAVKRRVKCIELDLEFESLSAAEKWSLTKANPNNKIARHQGISKVCSGERHTCGGYHWEYVDD